ncbi:LysR family transcriptional regulator [Pseudoclavibacter helvolus]|uniref:LysR family transcriptional regulator n=1 Tax=Pseudoclavibacter helvolus TaxID=255205 RepID=UPI00373595D3
MDSAPRRPHYGVVEPTLDLRQLAHFVVVAEELHFGRAAQRLHLSQPALSVQIRKLELSLGTALFTRDSRNVVLTPAGEVLLHQGRGLLAKAGQVARNTKELHGAQRGALRVGFQANAAAELTPQILSAFRAVHPNVHVEMTSFDLTDPYVGLTDGRTDVAFVRPPLIVEDWLGVETLFFEPRVLVVQSSSKYAAAGSVSVEEVLSEPFIARRSPEYWRNFWLAVDDRQGTGVRIGAEVSTVDECFEAIVDGRGVAFTQASTQRYYSRPGLTFVPVTDITPAAVSIAWRKDVRDEVVRDFVNAAQMLASLDAVSHTRAQYAGVPTGLLPAAASEMFPSGVRRIR